MECALGVFSKADGSAFFQQGNTIAGFQKFRIFAVLTKYLVAAVYGPREQTRGKALHDRATINCQYSMATFSTRERQRRTRDRRATEISLVMRQTFEAAILTQLFPRSTISIFVQILQADGGQGAYMCLRLS